MIFYQRRTKYTLKREIDKRNNRVCSQNKLIFSNFGLARHYVDTLATILEKVQ